MNTENFIIITGKNTEDAYSIVTLAPDISGTLAIQQLYWGYNAAILEAINMGYRPLNFSVQQGKIVEDWGSFSRFNTIPCFIIVNEIITQNNRTLGYRVYDVYSNVLLNVKIEQIKESIKANPKGILFQNAIIRDGAVCNYPNKEFLKLMVNEQSLKGRKSGNKQEIKTPKQVKKISSNKSFDDKQLKVIEKAKKAGITGSWLSNPNISAKQMDLLNSAKSRGALAEYFADPKIPETHINFWSDRLYEDKLARDCKPLIERPDIELEPLEGLFDCVVDGVKYDDLMDADAKKIRKEHYMRSNKFWTKPSLSAPKTDGHLKRYAEQLNEDCKVLATGKPVIKRAK